MFEALSAVTAIMKNAHLIQDRIKELKQRLQAMRVEAKSACQQVHVVVSGELKVISLKIAPEATNPVQSLEHLVTETVNTALVQARAKAAEELAKMGDGLGIPGLPQILKQIGGN